MEYTSLYRGKRNYELSNHLGNVQVIITDKRISVCDDMEVESFKADVLAAMDYYPFGMMMPDRQWYANSDSSNYRFGFNGKEIDRENGGAGNVYDYGFRIYNPALGKFLSVDPLTNSYPWYTPYQFSGNNPIRYIDLDGLEAQDPQDTEKKDNGGVPASESASNDTPLMSLVQNPANPAPLNPLESTGDPITTQEEADKRYSESFMKDFISKIGANAVGPRTGLNEETKKGVIATLENMADIQLKDKEGEALNLRVVEVVIYARDPSLISDTNPEGEVPGSRTTIVIVKDDHRSQAPIFVNPGREKNRSFGMVNLDGPDPGNMDTSTQYRILVYFQEIVVM